MEEAAKEVDWRPIVGYEETHMVSSTGLVKRLKGPWCRNDRILKPKKSSLGYLIIGLNRNNQKVTSFVHRLVAMSFLSNPENKPFVNHIDGNKANNNINNLEWATRQENEFHALVNNLKCQGQRNGRAKLTNEQVREIRQQYASGQFIQQQLAAKYGVPQTSISSIIRRKSWKNV